MSIRLLRSKKNKKKDHGVWIPLVQGTQIIAIDSLNTVSGMWKEMVIQLSQEADFTQKWKYNSIFAEHIWCT